MLLLFCAPLLRVVLRLVLLNEAANAEPVSFNHSALLEVGRTNIPAEMVIEGYRIASLSRE